MPEKLVARRGVHAKCADELESFGIAAPSKNALEIEDRHRKRPSARAWVRPLAVVQATDGLRTVPATV
ncbi:MAG TPA: hypothetical protein VNO82_01175 [Solirubrobacteraceae bacterium]|nr:hypothetical protein [Solirubrobacteraceae bacterium]